MYPSLSPYAFGADNPIYFVDKNGKWLGTTFIYSESSGGVGIGFGLYRVEQAGIARDKVGRTHFIISTSIHVNNQNSYDGSSHPNIAVGGDATIISASIKQDWSASTYLESVGVSAIEFKSPFAINTKLQLETPSLKLGIGVTGSFSKNSATIGIALGGGFTFNIIDSKVKESVSLTGTEADKVNAIVIVIPYLCILSQPFVYMNHLHDIYHAE